jgi:hypothetical protein
VCQYSVLDALDAVEDGGAMATLDVVETVRGGVKDGASQQ